MSNRVFLRYTAAGIAAVVAVLYFLIALGTIVVLTDQAQSGGAAIPAAAGVAFAVLAVLLALSGRRAVLFTGVALAIFTIVGYFAVAPNRTPQFETWGIVIKALQAFLGLALGYLAFAQPREKTGRKQLT